MSSVKGIPPGAYNEPAHLEWTDDSGLTLTLDFDCVMQEDWAEGSTVTEHPVEQGANVADHVRVVLPVCTLKVRATNEPHEPSTVGSPQQLLPLGLSINTPNWIPASGILQYQTWDNPIVVRAIAQALVGGITSATLGYPASAIASIGAEAAAQVLIPAQPAPQITPTNAGLVPPGPAPVPVAQVLQVLAGQDFVEALQARLVELKNAAQLITVYGSKQTETNMVIETLEFHRGGPQETGTGMDVTIGLKKVRVVSTQVVTAPIPNLDGGGGVAPKKKGDQAPIPSDKATLKSAALALVQVVSSLPSGSVPSFFGTQ